MKKSVRLYITGAVQGVFFRLFVKQNAERLDVRGFIRNLDDGNLEVFAEGRDENVNEFLKECKKGPPHADVKKVEFEDIKNQGFDGFKILKM